MKKLISMVSNGWNAVKAFAGAMKRQYAVPVIAGALLGGGVGMVVFPPSAHAASEGLSVKEVKFGTNGVATVAIPANRPIVLLKFLELVGLNTVLASTNTASALLLSEGSTNATYTITYTQGRGRYTNSTADYAYGTVEAISVRLTNTSLLSSSILTNTYTNALYGGVTYTNIITNMNSKLRVIFDGYSE